VLGQATVRLQSGDVGVLARTQVRMSRTPRGQAPFIHVASQWQGCMASDGDMGSGRSKAFRPDSA
jgi:hypothetical protein